MKYVLTIERNESNDRYRWTLIDAENQNFVVDCGISESLPDELELRIRSYEEECE
jgi:hypothetical protein